MPDWSYPQTNAQAGPSNPIGSRNRMRSNPDITYTHWSQHHFKTNPNAGFELLQGLMQMSGSHAPLPVVPETAFISNSTEELSTESTLSVLSNSTRNTDYTLGTPYSNISNSSSSAYPVSNTIPDIPLTSWMLQPEASSSQKQQLVNGLNSVHNGTAASSSYQGSLSSFSNPIMNRHSLSTIGHQAMGDLRQTSSYRNASSLQSSDGFRFPIIQPSAPSLHIRRDGHLPACLNFQSQLEDGEIVEPSQFMDPSGVRPPSTKYTTAENELWGLGPTSNKGSFHGNSSSQIEAHVRTQAITDKYQDSARTRAKGKGKDLIVEYESDLSTEDAAWLANADGQDDYSHDSGTADEDALAQDGYMRNCEPMIKSDKRKYKSTRLLGSVISRAPSQSLLQSPEAGQRNGTRSHHRNLDDSPQSAISSAQQTSSQSIAVSDEEDEWQDTTKNPCQPGERQRMAFVEMPPIFGKETPAKRGDYVYMGLPPLPLNTKKPARQAAAIAAQSLVDLARGFGRLAGIEEQITESEAEEEAVAELVIEGDKFLTRDDEGDPTKGTCHQCGKSSREAMMTCGNAETPCDLKYCKTCVQERYSFRFQADSRLLICPVCQGYCNCEPCLNESKLAEKLHLAEIMDGSSEETQRILRKYKNAQLFLEAMGATKAPPVPKTIIHGIRLVSKAKDKKSLPIPQDVYHELMKPEKMEVPYQSMIHLAGPITWAFPKKPIRKRKLPSKKQRPEDTYEKDGEERSESESDFDESRERKKARLSKKRWRQPHAAALPSTLTAELPVVPFSFALDSQGAILFGEDGCPLINPITSLPSDQSPPKRKGNRQVTFSSELNMYNSRAASHPLLQSEGQPQQLSQENMRRAVEFIHQQLQQQQERRENPENHVGFQLDPTLQAFLEQHNQDDQLVTSAKAMLEIPGVSEEQHPVLTHSESDAPQQESSLHLGAAMDDVQGLVIDADSSVLMANRRADMDPFSISPNMDTQTFDTLVAQVQQYQNGSPVPQSHRGFTGNELDAIFDVRSFNIAPDAQERSYDSAIDEAE